MGLAERLLALLDQAAVATTYKYALLLALLDASLDGTDAAGDPPDRVEVDRLAEHVLTMYWPHSDPYPGTGDVLRQSGTGQAEVLTQIRRFRQADPSARSTLPAARHVPGYDRLVRTTAWKLAEMPLPRLQRVGNVADPFLYSIGGTNRSRVGSSTVLASTERCTCGQPSHANWSDCTIGTTPGRKAVGSSHHRLQPATRGSSGRVPVPARPPRRRAPATGAVRTAGRTLLLHRSTATPWRR